MPRYPMSKLPKEAKAACNTIGAAGVEWGRSNLHLGRMQLHESFGQRVLAPVSQRLPLSLGCFIANLVGLVTVLVKSNTRRQAITEIYTSTGIHGLRAVWLAGKRIALKYREVIYLRALAQGETIQSLGLLVTQQNEEAIEDLRRGGQSFIVASLHFPKSASIIAYLAGYLPKETIVIHWDRATDSTGNDDFYRAAQAALQTRSVENVDAIGDQSIAIRDEPAFSRAALQRLVRTLKNGNRTCFIMVDMTAGKTRAIWKPFAGLNNRRFPLGVMRIASAAGIPVVPFAAIYKNPHHVEVLWGEAIAPPTKADKANAMKRLLDWLERVVADHPTEYELYIGDERTFVEGRPVAAVQGGGRHSPAALDGGR